MRERILSSVLLPAPLRPMMPTTSPGRSPTRHPPAPRFGSPARALPRPPDRDRVRERCRAHFRPGRREGVFCRWRGRCGSACPDRPAGSRSCSRSLRPGRRRFVPCGGSRTRRRQNHGRGHDETAIIGPGAVRAEQRPAESFDHARHRIDPVDRRQARPADCWDRRSASRTARTGRGTDGVPHVAELHIQRGEPQPDTERRDQRQKTAGATRRSRTARCRSRPSCRAARRTRWRSRRRRKARWRWESRAAGSRPW